MGACVSVPWQHSQQMHHQLTSSTYDIPHHLHSDLHTSPTSPTGVATPVTSTFISILTATPLPYPLKVCHLFTWYTCDIPLHLHSHLHPSPIFPTSVSLNHQLHWWHHRWPLPSPPWPPPTSWHPLQVCCSLTHCAVPSPWSPPLPDFPSGCVTHLQATPVICTSTLTLLLTHQLCCNTDLTDTPPWHLLQVSAPVTSTSALTLLLTHQLCCNIDLTDTPPWHLLQVSALVTSTSALTLLLTHQLCCNIDLTDTPPWYLLQVSALVTSTSILTLLLTHHCHRHQPDRHPSATSPTSVTFKCTSILTAFDSSAVLGHRPDWHPPWHLIQVWHPLHQWHPPPSWLYY